MPAGAYSLELQGGIISGHHECMITHKIGFLGSSHHGGCLLDPIRDRVS